MNQNQIRNILLKACVKAGGQKNWAKENGLSASYVNDVLLERREVADKIAEALGYKRIVSYRKANKDAKR